MLVPLPSRFVRAASGALRDRARNGMRLPILSMLGLVLLACGSDVSTSDPEMNAELDADAPFSFCRATKTLDFAPGQEQDLLDALNLLEECTVVRLSAGTFRFDNALTIRQRGITLVGAGKGSKGELEGTGASTVLEFTNAVANTNGIDHVGDWFTIRKLAIVNAKKDALRVEASTNVRIVEVRTEWTSENRPDNGKYGLYPVKSTNVLVQGCEAYNAADAGIYVGQTKRAVIRGNIAKQNVAGIEIENTQNADVEGNLAEDNTCGLVAFDLPGNPVAGTDVKIWKNVIRNNNRSNFGASVVGQVPAGTGTFVLASRRVELTRNTYANNNTVDVAVISGLSLEPNVELWAAAGGNWGIRDLWIHDNVLEGGSGDFVDNGTPDPVARPLGAVLAGLYAFGASQGVPNVEAFLWDGVDLTGADNKLVNDVNLCIENNALPANAPLPIVDLNLVKVRPTLAAGTPAAVAAAWAETSRVAQGAAPFACHGFQPPLAPVVLEK
jgi:parallel beta-helix repeat protein